MSGGGELVFLICGAIALIAAVMTISLRSPLRAAVALLVHVISLAGLYLTLHAHLLAAIQLMVYAGAIVVLFIFVIMLIGPSKLKPGKSRGVMLRSGVAALMAMVGASIAFGVASIERPFVDLDQCAEAVAECGQFGGVDGLSSAIFQQAAVPFELISVLLLVAIVAAVAVARGHSPEEKEALEKRSAEAKAGD